MKLDKSKKYIFAVSGGPDSMALLDMGVKENYNFIVCHVNYHKRDSAYYEMLWVKEYCDKNNVECIILNEEYVYKGNFQAFARAYRYDFFIKTLKENNCDGIVCAHHKDDLLETYLMQKSKNLNVSWFGLNEVSEYKGYKIYRPLLAYSKIDLENYCLNNNVKFFIDESNLKNEYTRNKFRNEVIIKMSEEEKNNILDEIKKLNDNKLSILNKIQDIISCKIICLKNYKKYNLEERLTILREWFGRYIGHYSYTRAYLLEIDKLLNNNKNSEFKIHKKTLVKSYQVCEIVGNCDKGYRFVIESNMPNETDFFKIVSSGKKIEGITVLDDEWPLIIRNFKAGDKIKLRLGTKKISRWFIDRKIPSYLRKMWPIVLNNRDEVIMVPGIGPDIYHYSINPNIFVVKY